MASERPRWRELLVPQRVDHRWSTSSIGGRTRPRALNGFNAEPIAKAVRATRSDGLPASSDRLDVHDPLEPYGVNVIGTIDIAF